MAITWNDDDAPRPPSEPRRYSIAGLTARQIRIIRSDLRLAFDEQAKGLTDVPPLDADDAADRAEVFADHAEILRAVEIAHSYAEIME